MIAKKKVTWFPSPKSILQIGDSFNQETMSYLGWSSF